MDIPPEEVRFQGNCKILLSIVEEGLEDLHERGHKVLDLATFNLVKNVISSFEPHYLIQGFIRHSHSECWEKIRIKNEKYFVDNKDTIFGSLPVENVNIFHDLFTTKDDQGKNIVSDKFKEQLWGLLHSLVKIAIKYIHKNRQPTTTRQGNREYACSFFDEVDILKHAETWVIPLQF